MQDYLSKFRVFSGWIGKKGMVKSLANYLPNVEPSKLRVKTALEKSKGWSENGVNLSEKITEADNIDRRFGLMLRMMLAFGLRRKEVMHVKVWKADYGDKLVIHVGEAKGGRPRDIYIQSAEQRIVLDFVKSRVARGEHLGWRTQQNGKDATLEYNISRYNRLMAKIGMTKMEEGVTGHGLRAQFAENAGLIAQMIPPTLGGTSGQMSKAELEVKRARVSELLGHSRPSITAAYYGSFGRIVEPEILDRFKQNMLGGIEKLTQTVLNPVPHDRRIDCISLTMELAEFDVDITLRQIHYFWEQHSKRFGIEWVSLQKSNLAALEAAAIKIRNETVKG